MSCDHPRTYRGHCVVCRAQNVACACDGAHWFDINGYCTKCGAGQEPTMNAFPSSANKFEYYEDGKQAQVVTFTSAKWGFEIEPMCEPKDAALRESMREARMLPAINVTFQTIEADRMMKEYAAFIDSMIAEAIARIEAKGEIALTEVSTEPPPPIEMVACKACLAAFATATGALWCGPCGEKRAALEAGPGITVKK